MKMRKQSKGIENKTIPLKVCCEDETKKKKRRRGLDRGVSQNLMEEMIGTRMIRETMKRMS